MQDLFDLFLVHESTPNAKVVQLCRLKEDYEYNSETDEIGSGAYGCVYRAKHKIDQVLYAIKIINLKKIKEDFDYIREEIRALAELEPHKGIVRYYTSWRKENMVYIQMEMCEINLREVLEIQENKEKYVRGLKDKLRMLLDIFTAVKYIHEKGMMHRDMKPENIFIAKDGSIKIGDFGIEDV